MRSALSALLLAVSAAAGGQDQDVQRALIRRDQQSAEFAVQVRGGLEARRAMEALHERQLRESNPALAHDLMPYERQRLSSESQTLLQLRPPIPRLPSDPLTRPLPLPGGPRPGVEPIAAPSLGG
ncbi:MAG TPA: hypothetical protein VHL85_02035 [Burkholderiales bacterium]|nr:hypothetical protein [Burkholderiales bacterium]